MTRTEAKTASVRSKAKKFNESVSAFCSQLGDTGFYSCIASTPSGEAAWKAHLEVHGKPAPSKSIAKNMTVGF